jgi:hypothetical protein
MNGWSSRGSRWPTVGIPTTTFLPRTRRGRPGAGCGQEFLSRRGSGVDADPRGVNLSSTFNRQSADPYRQGEPTVEGAPVVDLGRAAELALMRMLEAGRVVGRDGDGRRVVEVAVDDWIVDWFSPLRRRRARPRQRRATPRA